MELRHLRYFIAVAEELHFARAAERLHIEQSPLSRAIKDLEYDLDVQLLERTTRSTRLTWAGQVFLDEPKRVLSSVDQASASTKAAATGYRSTLRVALSDSIDPLRRCTAISRHPIVGQPVVCRRRSGNRALAIWGGAGASGLTLGSLASGFLTSVFDWPSVFFVNVLLAGLAIVAAFLVIPKDAVRHEWRAFDLPGALSVTTGASLLVYALVQSMSQCSFCEASALHVTNETAESSYR